MLGKTIAKIILGKVFGKTTICKHPFEVLMQNELGFNFKIIKNRNKFYLEYNQGNYKNEIKCNGKVMLNFDYEHEEIEIYALTEKEQKECFFSSKFIKEFEVQNIKEQRKRR